MNLSIVLGLLAIISALAAVGFGVRITSELRSRGIKANPLMVRWLIHRYLAEYQRVTVAETGRVGPLYNACVAALLLALVFGVITVIALAR